MPSSPAASLAAKGCAPSIHCKLDDGKQTRYLDIGGKFLDEKGELLPGILTDALYPSAKGYDIWYEAMHPLLEQMMQ